MEEDERISSVKGNFEPEITINDPDQFSFFTETFTVSILKQLHCLQKYRKYYISRKNKASVI